MCAHHRALAWEIVQHAGRHTSFLEDFHQHRAANGRLLGRLHDHGVASNKRRGRHSAEDCEGKIPRRNDKGDAARPVMIITFLAGNLLRQTRSSNPPHFLGVEKAKVDCLANVPVGFRPRFADLKNFQRGKLETAALHDGRCAFQQLRAFFK